MQDAVARQIQHSIQSITGQSLVGEWSSVGGGCINQAFCVHDRSYKYFVKLNQASKYALFETEALALQALSESQTIRVPQVICDGIASARSYLVLEWTDFGSAKRWDQMGQQLAALHRVTHAQGFGWHTENYIGETVQPNPWTQRWADFFVEHRLRHQLRLANAKGKQFSQAERLLDKVAQVLRDHCPQPALVHGDLWSGNAGFDQTGNPLIFDPASYYGDREVDLAMTGLFGGFPEAFYRGYQAAWPLDLGYPRRKTIYNLYHVLNHFNLFGGSYAAQAEGMMRQIIAEK